MLQIYGVPVIGLYAKPGNHRTRKVNARVYSTGNAYFYKYKEEQYFVSLTVTLPTVLGTRFILLNR